MKKIIKLFNRHSVSVFGAKGTGKDILFANVIARRKHKKYISNTDYKLKRKELIPLDLPRFMIGNTYKNFIENKINPYFYPYEDNIDIYIADCGVYFPSQYCGELNKEYKEFPSFMALSRHLGCAYVHTNAQNFNRVWDKIREQSDRYINTRSCVVLFGKIVIQQVRIYERYQSALDEIPPFRFIGSSLFKNKIERETELKAKQDHINRYGKIKKRLLIYINKSKYNTRLFKEILENGEKKE